MKKEHLKILGASISFWLILDLLLGIYQTRTFTFVDDHTLVSYFDELQQKGFWKLFNEILFQNDRFRPLLNIHKIIFLSIFSLNIHLWEIYFLILGGITSTIFIIYFQKINFSLAESIFTSILLLFGMHGVIWWVFDSSENIGMLFLGISLLALEKSKISPNNILNNSLLYTSILLMSFCKESFVFVLPLLAYLYRSNLRFSIFAIGLFLVELVIIKFYIQTTFGGYAGVDEATFSLKNIIKVVVQYLLRGYGFVLLFLLFFWLKESGFELTKLKSKINLGIIFILGVCPFILIYTKSGINVGRYVLPLLLGQLIIMREIYHELSFVRYKRVVLVITLVFFGYHSFKFWEIQNHFKNENIACGDFFSKIQQNIPKNAQILIIAHPQDDLEAGEALKKYLKSPHFLNRANTKLLYITPQDNHLEAELDTFGTTTESPKYLLTLNPAFDIKTTKAIHSGKYSILPQ